MSYLSAVQGTMPALAESPASVQLQLKILMESWFPIKTKILNLDLVSVNRVNLIWELFIKYLFRMKSKTCWQGQAQNFKRENLV